MSGAAPWAKDPRPGASGDKPSAPSTWSVGWRLAVELESRAATSAVRSLSSRTSWSSTTPRLITKDPTDTQMSTRRTPAGSSRDDRRVRRGPMSLTGSRRRCGTGREPGSKQSRICARGSPSWRRPSNLPGQRKHHGIMAMVAAFIKCGHEDSNEDTGIHGAFRPSGIAQCYAASRAVCAATTGWRSSAVTGRSLRNIRTTKTNRLTATN